MDKNLFLLAVFRISLIKNIKKLLPCFLAVFGISLDDDYPVSGQVGSTSSNYHVVNQSKVN